MNTRASVSDRQAGVPGRDKRLVFTVISGARRSEIIKVGLWVAVYLLIVVIIAHGSLYVQGLLLVAAIFGVLALGQNMSMGMLGLYSLGQAGLFGIGAYLTAILAEKYQINVGLLLLVSLVACGVAGALLGWLSLRVSGLYFAITTLIFTIVLTSLVEQLSITGGYSGLQGPTFPSFPGSIGKVLGSGQVWIIMGVLAVALVLSIGVRRSPFFIAMLATRDSEIAAEAAGVPTRRTKVWVFSLAAILAGAAGWAFSSLGFISPSQFTWSVSVNIMIMVLLGGINTVIGPLVGAAFISIFPAYVNITALMQEVLFGGILLLVVVVSPDGALGILRRVTSRIALWSGGRIAKLGPTNGGSALTVLSHGSTINLAGEASLGVAAVDGGVVRNGEASARRWSARPTLVSNRDGEEGEHAEIAIACRDVKYRYTSGQLYALDGVTVDILERKIHGLIGANGSGKSTLVDVIAGRRVPEAGRVAIRGRDVTKLPARSRAGLGLMRTFQHAELVDELTLIDNVLLGLYHDIRLVAARGFVWPLLPGAQREMAALRAHARDCLEEVGLEQWSDKRAADAPHGVIQLTQLAIVAAAGADIVLLDEPLAGLSSAEVAMVVELLKGMRAEGKTIVLIEHQVSAMAELADAVTVLDAGVVVIEGPAEATLRSQEVREVYLGAAT